MTACATSSGLPSNAALICDCDGVLIDSEALAERILARELHARWPDTDVEPVIKPLLGLRTERVIATVCAQLGRTLEPSSMEAIRRAVETEAQHAPLVNGIEAALSQIELPKACASNSNSHYVEGVLARTGLARYFGNRVFCADRVACPKPAPDVYLAAAHALGATPQTCLVVEDSVTGVTAANAAGMSVLGFTGGGHVTRVQTSALRDAGARQVFADMRELPALVARWRAEFSLNMNRKGDPYGKRDIA
jgi:HAD superfamily hydrolase (TIGR01509 family)